MDTAVMTDWMLDPNPAVLGEPCRCDRAEEHTPVLRIPLPVSIRAYAAVSKALSAALQENGLEGVLLSDGKHDPAVVYAVARRAAKDG